MFSLGPEIKGKIQKLAEEASRQEGCELYDWEYVGGRSGPVLRVYIDRETQPVSIDDCANVSRCLNLLLDAEDLLDQAYELEISSPGLERPLRQAWHFSKALGQSVQVKLTEPLSSPEGRKIKSLRGVLTDLQGENLVLQGEGQTWTLPMSSVQKANTLFVFPGSEDKKTKGKRGRL